MHALHRVARATVISAASAAVVLFAGVAPAFAGLTADINLTKTDSPDPVVAGEQLTYTLAYSNKGPSNADNAAWSDTLPPGTTFVSLASPAGWSCTTPAVGAAGTVTCSHTSFAPDSAFFTLIVLVDVGLADGTVLTNTATATSDATDPNPGDTDPETTTTVDGAPTPPAGNPTVSKVGSPGTVNAGDGISYTITYELPAFAAEVTLTDALPADLSFTSITAPPAFTCQTVAAGPNVAVSCSGSNVAAGTYVFTLNVATSFDAATGPVSNTVFTSAEIDGADREASDTETTQVNAGSVFEATKSVSSGPYAIGQGITYTVVLTNQGPLSQSDNGGDEFTDVLPPGLVLQSASATSGVPVANTGTNTVTWNGAIPAAGSVTISIQALINGSGTFANQGQTSFDRNNNGVNETAGVTDDPATAADDDPTILAVPAFSPEVPTVGEFGLFALAGLLGVAGLGRMNARGSRSPRR
jgi:uncharacterized repeat protein (TIGR01451 family)